MTGKNKFLAMVLLIPALLILTFPGCKNQAQTTTPEDVVLKDTIFHKVLSLQNISFEIWTTGSASMQTLRIQPSGLSIVNGELTHEIDGRIVEAEISDLNSDGYPEILIYTQSAGSGSYGNVIAYSTNNGKSVSQVYFPPLSDNPETAKGYMGHDEFTLIETSLAHRFPIYKEGDSNANPTGGMRQIEYKLVDGEASRRFEIVKISEIQTP